LIPESKNLLLTGYFFLRTFKKLVETLLLTILQHKFCKLRTTACNARYEAVALTLCH